jgi:hypothetical protein
MRVPPAGTSHGVIVIMIMAGLGVKQARAPLLQSDHANIVANRERYAVG